MFIREINPSYTLPSKRVVSYRPLQKRYTKYLLELGEQLKNVCDMTITLNEREYIFNYLIYAVMDITSVKQWILDFVHFTEWSTANAFEQQLIMSTNKSLLSLTSVIAFVSNSPTTIIRLRNNLATSNPNIVSLRCAFHQFNPITQDEINILRDSIELILYHDTMKKVFKKTASWLIF